MDIDLSQTHDVLGAYHSIDFSDIRNRYSDPGTKYAFDVLDECVISGYLIKLAAFRHLRDLQRQGTKSFPFHYDTKETAKILKFAAVCPNVDTGEPTKLMDWQEFIFCQLFGWRDGEGLKRFTQAILSVARGQGKTYLMAIYMCYTYLIESLGYSNQDYLVTAENTAQTYKLFGYISDMIPKILDQQPIFSSLAKEVGLAVLHNKITMRKTNNNIYPLTYNSGKYDSYHFRTAVFDEIGNIKNSTDGAAKITSGQVKVKNHQFVQISTAYPDPAVPYHASQRIVQQAMEEDYKRDGDDYLGLIWAQDTLDETYQTESWYKSNPLLYLKSQHNVLIKGLLSERNTQAMQGTIDRFQNKNMNMWLQENTNSFLKLADISRAVKQDFIPDGRQVYVGFDYSMFSDNTAVAFVIPYQDEQGNQRWHLKQHSFVPWNKAGSIEAKEKQDGIEYRQQAKRGYCTITSHPQGLINDDQVYQWLLDFVADNDLKVLFFGYDAWGATNAIKQMEINTEWPLNPIRQRTSELKDPTKFLQRGFVEGSITRDDDPIMAKALLNAEIIEDKIGIQVDKAKATLKIDVVDAIIDAFYQGMYHFEDFGIANDKSKQVELMTQEQVRQWLEDQLGGD